MGVIAPERDQRDRRSVQNGRQEIVHGNTAEPVASSGHALARE
jgi:hypothetical protein